jgi:hypothetical protein
MAAGGAGAVPDGGVNLLNMCSDTVFKRVFGNKDLLENLLKAVAPFPVSLDYIADVEMMPDSIDGRRVIFDLHCVLTDKTHVIVELQRAYMCAQTAPRMLGYTAKYIADQWSRDRRTAAGLKGYALLPVYTVALLNFPMSVSAVECGQLVQHFCIRPLDDTAATSQRLRGQFSDLMRITIVQLPLAAGVPLPGSTPAYLWAHLLHKSEAYRLETLPQPLQQEPYRLAAELAVYMRLTDAEKSNYDKERDAALEQEAMAEDFRLEAERATAAEAACAAAETARAAAEAARAEEAERAAAAEVEIEKLRKLLATAGIGR